MSEFLVPWTNYFDDSVTFADGNEQSSIDGCIRFMLKALGWRFAEAGDTAPPFNSQVNALGVAIDVSCMGDGKLIIDNTTGRKNEISSLISAVLESRNCLVDWLRKLCQLLRATLTLLEEHH